MPVRTLDIAEPFFTIRLVTDETDYRVDGKKIVLNLSDKPIGIREQTLGSLQSVVVADVDLRGCSIACHRSGTVFFTEAVSGKILRYERGELTAIASLQVPGAIAIGTDGMLYAQDRAAGWILRIDPRDGSGVVRFVDQTQGRIYTLNPPPVPVRDYGVDIAPRIPSGWRTDDELAPIDGILTTVATSRSEAELGGTLEKISSFIRQVIPCSVSRLTPLAATNGEPEDDPVSRIVRPGTV